MAGVHIMKRYLYWPGILATIMLGIILAVAGIGKILSGTSGYDAYLLPSFIPEALTGVAYVVIPYIEVVVGLLLIIGIGVKLATSISAGLITCFVTSNLYLMSIGVGTCGDCFGVGGGLTVYAALVIDGLMALMVAVIFLSNRGSYFNIIPWYLTGHTVTGDARARRILAA